MKPILKPFKSVLSIIGIPLPKTQNKGLKRNLHFASDRSKPTMFKNLLCLRGWDPKTYYV